MKRTLSNLVLLLVVAGSPTPAAQPEKSSPGMDYESFRIITERNIFDPNRSGRGSHSSRKGSSKRGPGEFFALLGTLSYEKGSFAFFDGSSSQYRSVLETSNNIAGYTIAAITASHVRLELTNGQAIELPVGMQMNKQDQGDWTLVARAEPTASSGRLSASADKPGADGPETPVASEEEPEKVEKTAPSLSGAADGVLKRLMQKREQELTK